MEIEGGRWRVEANSKRCEFLFPVDHGRSRFRLDNHGLCNVREIDRSWVEEIRGAINDANLSRFRAANGRLLISQAVNDQIVMYENTVDYYRRVAESAGGIEESRTFVRLFSTDGDIHGSIAGPGPGLTPASAMSALMNWVENGIPPEEIIAERVDPQTGELVATRPVYPYPDATIYRGTGDPSVAASFMRAKGAAA